MPAARLVNVVDVILDDDTCGTSFRRFDPVIERVRQGEIQVLVFKDASRLGRNLKESLIFVDLVESCGAEILFESEEYNEDFFPLKAWFNEQRAKEDGRKIRRVLRHKVEAGTLLIKPFYGYRPGEAGRTGTGQNEPAGMVRWIFQRHSWGGGAGRSPGHSTGKDSPRRPRPRDMNMPLPAGTPSTSAGS
ncbi:MAG: recombinase family protein [Oscillospiraceae bacterium]